VRNFPNVTNVDMTATLNQVQGVLDKVIRAVEFLFGFTLAAGVVVLFAAVTATREERAREFAIMRAVGARSSLLPQVPPAQPIGLGPPGGLPGRHLDTGAVEKALPPIRKHVKIPVGVGFGIRDAATAKAIGRVADAVVIGTKVIQVVEELPREKVAPALSAFLREIRQALDDN